MRYGSLCSGIGGLDRAIERVLSARPAWFCEADKHAATVLERHWPGVPVLPDIKTQDWSQVEPVELVSAGYPCQPFSAAGRRQGVDDPRHLWPFVIAAVRVLRPRLVVLENVSGHLGLGFDAVLCDLAEAGFDAEWCVVPASAAGACHRRERLFVLAHAHADSRTGGPANGRDVLRRRPNEAEQVGLGGGHPSTDASGEADGADGRGAHDNAAAAWQDRALGSGGSGAVAADAERSTWRTSEGLGPRPGEAQGARSPSERGRCGALSPDPDGGRLQGSAELDRDTAPDPPHGDTQGRHVDGCRLAATDTNREGLEGPEPAAGHDLPSWGDYGPAIERWEHVLGRAAPAPVDERGRLNVPFVEWMMGFDAGWVDALTRTAALRCLGNAVVQQQGELALRMLMEIA